MYETELVKDMGHGLGRDADARYIVQAFRVKNGVNLGQIATESLSTVLYPEICPL